MPNLRQTTLDYRHNKHHKDAVKENTSSPRKRSCASTELGDIEQQSPSKRTLAEANEVIIKTPSSARVLRSRRRLKDLGCSPRASSSLSVQSKCPDTVDKPIHRLKQFEQSLTPPKSEPSRRNIVKSQNRKAGKKLDFDHCQEDSCSQESNPVVRALSQSVPSRLICRDNELAKLTSILSEALSLKNTAVYLSGPPGTGKTASVKHTLACLKLEYDFKEIYINCMNLRQVNELYKVVAEGLGLLTKGKSAEKIAEELERKDLFQETPIIVVLDEMDLLQCRHQPVLRRVFQWPFFTNSSIVALIGISNLLNLTDKNLPFLTPLIQRLHFEPYSAQQISSILKDRLSQCHEALHPSAVELCARKVAAVTGDMRKALDLCRVAVQQNSFTKTQQLNSEVCKTPEQIGVASVLHAVGQVYNRQLPTNLPLQQKILLASLLKLARMLNQAVTLSKVYLAFKQSCHLVQATCGSQQECLGLCQLLEAQGLVSLKRAKNDTSNVTISLALDEALVRQALQDQALLSTILHN